MRRINCLLSEFASKIIWRRTASPRLWKVPAENASAMAASWSFLVGVDYCMQTVPIKTIKESFFVSFDLDVFICC